LDTSGTPIRLRSVLAIAPLAEEVVNRLRRDLADVVDAEVHHIGATAMSFGHTKGDVDVNIRVERADFSAVVAALKERFAVAQPENWTPTFASFSSDRYALPLGIQLTALGSADDHLLSLHERLRADPGLVQQYDEIKRAAAPRGATAYWEAKNAFLQRLLAESD
jgi:GrpB-like predicted nucleotidyltransferase (UPF0157 family)